MASRPRRAPVWALCAVVTTAAFAITLRDDFGSDDFAWIAWARRSRLADVLASFRVWRAGHEMPLIYVAFWLQYSLFGLHPWAYRVVSVGIHAVNVVLVYEIGRRLLRAPLAAPLAALLFAVHPAHSQAVMWDAAIQHLTATAFSLTALLLFLRYLDDGAVSAYVASLVAMTLALLAKEEAASLPLVCLLAELLLYPTRPAARRALAYAPMAALLAGYLVVRLGASHESYLTIEGHYALGWHMPGKLWEYLEALAFPLPAHLVDLLAERAPWFAVVRGAAAAAILVALCASASRAPRLLAFFLAWLLLAPVPFLPFTWGIQSRYAYLPAIPFCLLAALAVERAWSSSAPRWRIATPVAGLLAICSLFSVYNERSSYVTGALSAQLMTELSRTAREWPPGTTIVLVDSPLAANSVRPILFLSHPASARNVKVVNVARGSREYESAVADPAAVVFVYERGAFAAR